MTVLRRGLKAGDRVRADRNLRSLGDRLRLIPGIPEGRQGIVRDVRQRDIRQGRFSRHVVVEFEDGLQTRVLEVPGRHVRRAIASHGEAAWQRRRDRKIGIRLGGLLFAAVFTVPPLITYFRAGGTVSALLPELVLATLEFGWELLDYTGSLKPFIVAMLVLALIGAMR